MSCGRGRTGRGSLENINEGQTRAYSPKVEAKPCILLVTIINRISPYLAPQHSSQCNLASLIFHLKKVHNTAIKVLSVRLVVVTEPLSAHIGPVLLRIQLARAGRRKGVTSFTRGWQSGSLMTDPQQSSCRCRVAPGAISGLARVAASWCTT